MHNPGRKQNEWDLSWESPGYLKLREIGVEGNKTSFVAVFENADKAKEAVSIIRGWFADNECLIETVTGGSKDYLRIKFGNHEVFLGEGTVEGAIVALCDNDQANDLRNLLSPFRAMKEYSLRSVGELKHGTQKLKIQGSKIIGHYTAGILSESAEPAFLTPYIFYEFRSDRRLVGKAYLSYYDFEMNECAPTIEMFEVKKVFRRKGIGSKMYQAIEKVTADQGFDRILLTDIRSSKFWEAMGFETDLDEATKFLV